MNEMVQKVIPHSTIKIRQVKNVFGNFKNIITIYQLAYNNCESSQLASDIKNNEPYLRNITKNALFPDTTIAQLETYFFNQKGTIILFTLDNTSYLAGDLLFNIL